MQKQSRTQQERRRLSFQLTDKEKFSLAKTSSSVTKVASIDRKSFRRTHYE
jgi:hypothetical protein